MYSRPHSSKVYKSAIWDMHVIKHVSYESMSICLFWFPSVTATSRPAVNVESAGAEALLAAIEVLDAIPQSMETAAARTENVMNDDPSPSSSHQPEPDEKFE